MRQSLDFDAFRLNHPISEVIGQHIQLVRAGNEFAACCPFHADKSPSFYVVPDKGFAHCFGCGWSGDVLDFVARFHDLSLSDAARRLDGDKLPVGRYSPPEPAPAAPKRSMDWARKHWRNSLPAAGTLAEAYLRFRGVRGPIPPDIRFQRLACDEFGHLPCLVAAVRDLFGSVTGIQRIWLAHDGRGKAEVPQAKRSLGQVKGGAIRLGDLDGSGTVTVCEGPEDGLSLLEMVGGPVWVAAGASFLPAMEFPAEVQSVVIGADNDGAGKEAAEKAARTFASRGLSVRIIRPLEGFKDFNDELRGAR